MPPQGQFLNATTLDIIRIDCIGEGRAVTAYAQTWLLWKECHAELLEIVQDSLRLTTSSLYPDWYLTKARAAVIKALGPNALE